jgi:Cu(I)/Ag(I) efflux system membrane fusion protein
VTILALIAAVLLGGYALDHHQTEIDIAAAAAERTPLYYQDPSGKPDYSPTPKKDAEGRDYVLDSMRPLLVIAYSTRSCAPWTPE